MLGFQNAIFVLILLFCILAVSADSQPSETDVVAQESPVSDDLSRFVRAAKNQQKKKGKTVRLDKVKTTAVVTAARFNILVVGGTLNMVFSLINLVLGLLNFYLLYGRYDLRLRQICAKVKLSVEEMASRDMHPKIKMALSRTFPPEGTLFPEVMNLLSQPSPLFDHTNGLLKGQKEARLRKVAGSQKAADQNKKKAK